ncbi:MAG TPA: hypothetical protein VKD46_08050, partial [bacterium]|nr:hypothetical protein [bacterium]
PPSPAPNPLRNAAVPGAIAQAYAGRGLAVTVGLSHCCGGVFALAAAAVASGFAAWGLYTLFA